MKILIKEWNFIKEELIEECGNDFANNIVIFDEVGFELHGNVNVNAGDI